MARSTLSARAVQVRGVVQGVGFRPRVFHLAREHALTGWVLNADAGVDIHVEGDDGALEAFVRALTTDPPPAAQIASLHVARVSAAGFDRFTIRESERRDRPTAHISIDLPVCDDCLRELLDPEDRRGGYAYINCAACGPRYSIIESLPYDRARTTMRDWTMCKACEKEYCDPLHRRFHAQPVSCHACGPEFVFHRAPTSGGDDRIEAPRGLRAIELTAQLLASGSIVAIKGIGGYHLACDAANADAVAALRERKYRKERPFAVMVRDAAVAHSLGELSNDELTLLSLPARPIVLARARVDLPGVAPDCADVGLMLPYTPLHHLLFAFGAPDALVMTSGNRSSEPIAYQDADAQERLGGIADAFLVGERPIARRVDDSVVRVSLAGPAILRRSRGYAPSSVASIRSARPILAVGADLKNAVTLVVDGQAFVSQHLGDLDDFSTFRSFSDTIEDLVSMYRAPTGDMLVVHDAHPEYRSTAHARSLPAGRHIAVQHHRAHVASVLAERHAWHERVVGLSCDGTGYGDDGTIWGGEIFVGSVAGGLDRVAHLRPIRLAGGDAAARHPVQAAAGFLAELDDRPDLTRPPFDFPRRYTHSLAALRRDVRVFTSTSMGRLFDAVAALVGFTREMTFEGQAAVWLEQLARRAAPVEAYEFPFVESELDFRPLLGRVIDDRLHGRSASEIAYAFHAGLACGLADAAAALAASGGLSVVVASGGVFQNLLLVERLRSHLPDTLQLWTNHAVPPNDGGISLGQAALAAFTP